MKVNARAIGAPHEPFRPIMIDRRELHPRDVLIDIAYAGICHSDIEHAHSLRGPGKTIYPLVPGHEIAGTVAAVGPEVTKLAVGDRAGVGVMIDSCRECRNCQRDLEQYCSNKRVLTYNSRDYEGNPTHGGYSEKIVVDERFVLRIPEGISLASAAPLFCAGITLYSPLRHWKAGPGTRVAVVGFGGLGHVGVKIAKALGASVTVLDLAEAKHDDALRMGADELLVTRDPKALAAKANAFDLVLSTVPGNLDLELFLRLLDVDGTFVNLAATPAPLSIGAATLLENRRSIAGTRSGGLAETQEMIEFCAAHGIGAEVEIVSADRIDEAFGRLHDGDVRYRFVIDVSTMR